ncbi:MAG: TolC family protein [Deltaproteobacteria bacterium]|nr:TolC family protein [Deltaproteobacteria bacterium]
MRLVGPVVLALFAIVLSPSAWAQALPLERVLESVQRHPDLVAADAVVRQAAGERLRSAGAFDPTVNAFVGGRPLGYYDQAVGGASLSVATPVWGLQVEGGWRVGVGDFATYEGKRETLPGGELFVGVSVPLLKGGPMDDARADRLKARFGEDLASAERTSVTLDLAAQAEMAYWGWAAAVQALQIARDQLDLATRREAGLRRKVEEGAVAPINALEARRSVLSRESKLAAASAKERAAASKLSLFLRDATGQPLLPATEEAPVLPEPASELRLGPSEAAQQAWVRRPEGQAWRAAEEVARVTERLARAQTLPKLDLKVGAAVDLPQNGQGSSALAEPTLDARLDLSFPTLLREGRGKLASARAKSAQVDAKATLVREKMGAAIVTLAAQIDAAEARLKLADESAEVTAALARAETARFNAGASDLLVVNLREQALASAQEQRAMLRAEVLGLRAGWRALVDPDPVGAGPASL